ncbi:hypothetical protein CVT25_001433 [Psilocybe cyanescens]|uniref:thioredoxin-dependent peroxiredoxin n=1 Tax=Psilocybe cyanescens TaxID=93625 RepID=A0A409WNQ8_PSICY|nr:hypothetical protein CVT25_001433 [Psilocybe cyanescens]
MAPRKASDAPTAEPRRSGRIASQPAVPVPEKSAPKPKAPKATKKRSAEALDEAKDGEATAAKKAAAAAEAEGSNAAAESEPKQLEIGDSLPELTLQNEKGEDVKVAELGAEKGVILFLVPKADTPGCTTQACGFRDSYPDFTSLNYDVYCLSADTPTAQSKWQTKANPKRLLITALGAGAGGKTKRSHFIFAKGGKLVEKKLPVTPADSPKLALAFIKSQTE